MKLGSRPPSDAALASRLTWATGIRLAFVTALLALVAGLYLRDPLDFDSESLRLVAAIIGSVYALAIVYAAWLRTGRALEAQAAAQIMIDQLTCTVVVYVSGGHGSAATSLYALVCLAGVWLLGTRGGVLGFSSGLILYATLIVGLRQGWIEGPSDQASDISQLTVESVGFPFLVDAVGMFGVTMLAGMLADRLRRAGGALAEAEARAKLAERYAELGKISAWLAHEIRNPLGSIVGSIEMLKDAEGLDDEDRQLFDIVHLEANRLDRLVKDMLDLSKAPEPKPERVDLTKLVGEVRALAANSAERGHGSSSLVLHVPEEPVFVECDANQMRQVMWNLVRNAIQATGQNGEVDVTLDATADAVRIAVRDSGPGLTPEDRERIFEAFGSTSSHGTGIGLAVVKRIVEAHEPLGASIRVEEPRAGGAEFVLELPRLQD